MYFDEERFRNSRFALLRRRSNVDSIAQNGGTDRERNGRAEDGHGHAVDLTRSYNSTRHNKVRPATKETIMNRKTIIKRVHSLRLDEDGVAQIARPERPPTERVDAVTTETALLSGRAQRQRQYKQRQHCFHQ